MKKSNNLLSYGFNTFIQKVEKLSQNEMDSALVDLCVLISNFF